MKNTPGQLSLFDPPASPVSVTEIVEVESLEKAITHEQRQQFCYLCSRKSTTRCEQCSSAICLLDVYTLAKQETGRTLCLNCGYRVVWKIKHHPREIDLALVKDWLHVEKLVYPFRWIEIDAMEAALKRWGKEHNYPSFSFPLAPHDPSDLRLGFLRPGGEEQWKRSMCPDATMPDYYCGEWLVACILHIQKEIA